MNSGDSLIFMNSGCFMLMNSGVFIYMVLYICMFYTFYDDIKYNIIVVCVVNCIYTIILKL